LCCCILLCMPPAARPVNNTKAVWIWRLHS